MGETAVIRAETGKVEISEIASIGGVTLRFNFHRSK